jgi:hypothetical protein
VSHLGIWWDTPLLGILHYINKQKPRFFCACCSMFSITHNFSLIFDITIVKSNITSIFCGFFVVSLRVRGPDDCPLPTPLSGNVLYMTVIKISKMYCDMF